MTQRYHLNVVGDFFVEAGCCTMCGVPQSQAPELFTDDGTQCYVAKQPGSSTELHKMYGVLAAQDLDCVRYGGRDATILAALSKIDHGRHIVRERRGLMDWLKARFRY
jgi:hypothetical protein